MRPSTFSILALDGSTGELGVAVASKFLAVGALVPWARAGVGAVATQARANLSFGPCGLALLEEGLSAKEAVARLVRADEGRDYRQLGMVDSSGSVAAWTGRNCLPWSGDFAGKQYSVQGNILAGENVLRAMADTFESTAEMLPERLINSLAAGQAAGGDSRGQQSASLLVVKEQGSYGGYLDRYIDLRADDHHAPIEELQRMLVLHRLYFGATDKANLSVMNNDATRMVQGILARTGWYAGPIDGVYGPATREAFRRWCSIENFEERWREDQLVDGEILAYMRRRYGA